MTQTRRATMQVVINSDEQRRRAIDAIMRCNLEQPMEMVLKLHEPRRTLSMNALYWQWMTQLAEYFSKRAGPFSCDDMHAIMKHKFLGYTDERIIGGTRIPAQLKSTAKLRVGEMLYYMSMIDAWAVDYGCLLVRPEDSQYEELIERENS